MCIKAKVRDTRAAISFGLRPGEEVQVCPRLSSIPSGLTVFNETGPHRGMPWSILKLEPAETEVLIQRIKQQDEFPCF